MMMLAEGKHFQVLESLEADFENMKWSFAIQDRHSVGAGQYAIVPVVFIVKNNAKLDHAERLLRHLREVVKEPHEVEKIDSFFDPEPL